MDGVHVVHMYVHVCMYTYMTCTVQSQSQVPVEQVGEAVDVPVPLN